MSEPADWQVWQAPDGTVVAEGEPPLAPEHAAYDPDARVTVVEVANVSIPAHWRGLGIPAPVGAITVRRSDGFTVLTVYASADRFQAQVRDLERYRRP